MRLRSHLVVLVAIALVPLLAFAVIVAGIFVDFQRKDAERGFQETARALAVAVDRALAGTIGTLEALAASRALDGHDLRAFHDEALRVLSTQAHWTNIVLARPDGRQVVNAPQPLGTALPAIADRKSHDLVVTTGAPTVGDLLVSPTARRPVLPVRVPVVRQGRLRYVLSVGLRPEAMSAILAAQHIPADWTGAMLDKNRVIIARSRAPERFLGRPATARLAARTTESAEGSFWDVTQEGTPAYGVFSRSSLSGWTVVLGIPAGAAGATVRQAMWTLGGGGLVLVAAALTAALIVGARVAAPIARLAGAASAWGRGGPLVVPPPGPVREVAEVARALEAAAVERTRAQEALRLTAERLGLLVRTSHLVSSSLDTRAVLAGVAASAARIMDVPSVSFWLADDDARRLQLVTFSSPDLAEDFPYAVLAYGEGVLGEIAVSHQRVHVPDVSADPRILSSEWFRRHGFTSFLGVPVVWEGTLLAVLSLNARAPFTMTAEDEELLDVFVAQAAVSLANARLFEREQAARAEAESANRAKDEFLAVLSHELRTPLNAVLGWARMLATTRLDAATAARALDAIQRNATAQTQLIGDLLEVSRIMTGKLRLEVRPVDPGQVVDAALDAVRPAAQAKDIQLQPVLDPSAGPVLADPDRLQQVVWNLLTNAIKFTPRKGRVQAAVRRDDDHVAIEVRDTGEGIAPELLPHVFERFRQADSSSTRQHGGLGLGLALVRHLVELHGGTVSAASPGPGQGATFTVRLPVLAHAPRAEPPAASPPAPAAALAEAGGRSLAGLRCLIVEDDPDSRDVLAHVLKDRDAEVRTATSAAEGLAILREWQPSVLLSDIEMPGEDGYRFIQRVRALPAHEGGAVPAVAVTAYGRLEDRIRALSAGYQSHVAKPVEPAELIAVVLSLTGRALAG